MTRDGNVIYGEFGKSRTISFEIKVEVDYEVLYSDEDVVLVRASGSIAGKPFLFHTMAGRGVSG